MATTAKMIATAIPGSPLPRKLRANRLATRRASAEPGDGLVDGRCFGRPVGECEEEDRQANSLDQGGEALGARAGRPPGPSGRLEEQSPEQVAEREEDEHHERHRHGGEGDEREIRRAITTHAATPRPTADAREVAASRPAIAEPSG